MVSPRARAPQGSDRFLEKVPFSFLIFSFVTGLMLLFFSPLRLLLPEWILYPFSQKPPDIWGSFLAIILCSIFIGIPMYLVYPLLCGMNGLNHRIVKHLPARLGDSENEKKDKEQFDVVDSLDLLRWARDKEYASFLDFLEIQRQIINGLITGGEIVLILNVCVALLLNWRLLEIFSVRDWTIWLSLLPGIIFSLTWAYNKWYFRDKYNGFWESMKRRARELA